MNCEKVISRKNLTKEEWLVYRRSGIGGSDAGAIAGLNPYSTAYSAYLDKLGEAEPITETEAMRQGMELEEYVAKRFCEHTGKRVKRCEYILRSKAHPFMLADVDRLVVGENAVLECKTGTAIRLTARTIPRIGAASVCIIWRSRARRRRILRC